MFHAPLRLLLVVATLLETGWSLWLSRRQLDHVSRHRDVVPADFAASVTAQDHARAADYTVARERLSMLRTAWNTVLGIGWLFGGFDLLAGAIATLIPPSPLRSVAFVLAWLAIATLASLPFAIIGTFGIEQRFGFNRSSPALFVLDRLKAWAIGLAVATPLLAGCFWLMAHASGLWWLYVWLGVLVLMAAGPAVYVRLIAPRFNRFTTLPEGELRQAITSLMQSCGFHAQALFTMDASRRSAHGNAYFIGFGRSKRIVLFDTLVQGSPVEEIRAVIAHELGHFKHRHVITGLFRAAGTSFVALALFGWLADQPWLLPAIGFHQTDPALSLVACLLVWSLAEPLLGLMGNVISRKHEFQADAFARAHAGADAMVAALVRLSRENASTLTPDPLYALYHYSHPPVPLRIARLRTT